MGSNTFFGRERETDDLARMLKDSHHPVVTITGIGGVGKTTLARMVEEKVRYDFRDGSHFLALTELEHSGQLAPAIITALGGTPTAVNTVSQLVETLSRRSILLILDNFEHIISAVPIIQAIAGKLTDSVILVTSRTRLGFPGESVYNLSGMDVQGNSSPAELPSVKLFLANADIKGSTPGDYRLIVDICNSLAGIPLGIKLISSMTQHMTLEEINGLVSHKDKVLDVQGSESERRHRSLRAVFDYSWNLLTPSEKKSFAALSIFRSVFSAEAAAEVTGTESTILASLVRKSLLEQLPGKYYEFHPLLKEFSSNMYRKHYRGADELFLRHAFYFSQFLKDQGAILNTSASAGAMEKLNKSFQDIMSALHSALEIPRIDLLQSSLVNLRLYLMRRGLLETGKSFFEKLVDVLSSIAPELKRAACVDLGGFLVEMAMYDQAVPLLEEACRSSSRKVTSTANYTLGMVYMRTGNLKRSEEFMIQSLEESRKAEGLSFQATALAGMGDLYNHLHDAGKAEYFLIQAVEINRRIDDIRGLFSNLITLSNLMYNHRRGEEALEYSRDALELVNLLQGDLYAGLAEISVASALEILGKFDEALKHAERSVKLFEGIDSRWGMQTAYSTLTSIQNSLKMASESLLSARILESLCKEIGGTYNSMEYLIVVGDVYLANNLNQEALAIYRKAEKIAKNLNVDLYLNELGEKISSLS